jgi:hypothetical protein
MTFQWGIEFGKKKGFLHAGDAVICITGWRRGAGSSNTIRVVYVDDKVSSRLILERGGVGLFAE